MCDQFLRDMVHLLENIFLQMAKLIHCINGSVDSLEAFQITINTKERSARPMKERIYDKSSRVLCNVIKLSIWKNA